jgi:hypothetical protein
MKSEKAIRTERPSEGPLPSYFVLNCAAASAGGRGSYSEAAWHLAVHVWGDFITHHGMSRSIALLDRALERRNEGGVLAWFDRHYPRCMALVPRRRRAQFARGIWAAHEQERI